MNWNFLKFNYFSSTVISKVVTNSEFHINNMYTIHISKFLNSTISHSKVYDFVCIGPYACTAGKRIHEKLGSYQTKSYFINDCIEQLQPSLICTHHNPSIANGQPVISRLDKLMNYPASSQRGCGVKQIIPETSQVVMHNGEILKYKQLIYSGNHSDWKNSDLYKSLSRAVSTPYTSVYGDGQYHCKNLHELYHRNNSSPNTGDIIFSIPKGTHFGYENLFFMHLYDSLKQWSDRLKNRKYFRITVVLGGDTFFPFAPQHDIYMKKKIMDDFPNIRIVYGAQVAGLDCLKRRITINGDSTPYQALFQYVPLKTPSLLQKSSIDPFDVNKKTLLHNKFSNVWILGNNIKQSTYSFYALNYRVNAIVENVCASLIGSKSLAAYGGNSMVPLWINRNEVIYLDMNYQKASSPEDFLLLSNKYVRQGLGKHRMLFSKLQIEYFMKGASCGFPYYLTTPRAKAIIQSHKSYVPMVVRKTV